MDEKYTRPPMFTKFDKEKHDFRSLGLIMWIYMGISLILSFLLSGNDSETLSVVVTLFVSLLTILCGLKMTKTNLSKFLFQNKCSIRQFKTEFILMNGMSMAALLMILVGSGLFTMVTGKSFPQATFDFDFSNISGWVMLLYVCILGPIVEEILFRGVILRTLAKYDHVFAIVSSALIFGLFHMYLEQGLHAFVLGLIFAYVSLKYDSLFVPILLHIVHNTMITFADFSFMWANIYVIFRFFCIFYLIYWLSKNIEIIRFKLRESSTYYRFYSHLFFRVSFILFFVLFILETIASMALVA